MMKLIKNFLCATLILLPAFYVNVYALRPTNGIHENSIIKYISKTLPSMMKQYQIPGAAVVIANKDGAVWTQGFGKLSKNNSARVTTKTLFDVGSVSKIFTATGVMIAAQNRLLNLKTPINLYLSSFVINSRFTKDPMSKITLTALLNHTAGFEGEPAGNGYDLRFASFKARIDSMQKTWLKLPVGEMFSYSNMGFDLAGYILQKQSKMSFAIYMQNNLFKPLEMTGSTFDENQIKTKNVAMGSMSNNKVYLPPFPILPSTSLFSNASDLGKYISFQLNNGNVNGKQILSEDAIKRMLTIQSWMKYQATGYGLGVYVTKSKEGNIYWHSGTNRGFNAILFWIPEQNIGMAILINKDGLQYKLIKIMEKVVLLTEKKRLSTLGKINLSPKVSAKKISTDKLKSWVGNYISSISLGYNDAITLIVKENKLYLSVNKNRVLLKYIGNRKFYDAATQTLYQLRKSNNPKMPNAIISVGMGGVDFTWYYNDGPNDKSGSNKESWRQYIGNYIGHLNYERPRVQSYISLKNGYLYLNIFNKNYRLKEFKPGLFVLCTGNVLDLQKKPYQLGTYMALHKVIPV